MKTYKKPNTKLIELENEQLLAGSEGGGVDTGGTPGSGFDPNQPSYTKKGFGLIDDDDEE